MSPAQKSHKGPVRAIGYTRVSTGLQARSGLGLTDQRAQITEEVQRRGWQLLDIAEDAGLSGKAVVGRDALVTALARLDRGEADALIAAKLDRISRSVQDLAALLERSKRRGWSLIALDSDVDTSRPSGRFVLQVIGAAAEYERLIIGERVAASHSVRRAQGIRGGQAPLLAPELRHRIVGLHDGGLSLHGVARLLNEEGVATARGASWYASTVAHVLRSVALDTELVRLAHEHALLASP